MKTVFVFLGSILLYFFSNAQIIEVKGGIYTQGCYSMQSAEGWKRVETNGYPSMHRKGFINFTKDHVTIQLGATSSESEVYKTLKFKYDVQGLKNVVVFGDLQHNSFLLLDSQGNEFNLSYFMGKYFTNNKNIFILSDLKSGIMYFLQPTEDVSSIVSGLYQ